MQLGTSETARCEILRMVTMMLSLDMWMHEVMPLVDEYQVLIRKLAS